MGEQRVNNLGEHPGEQRVNNGEQMVNMGEHQVNKGEQRVNNGEQRGFIIEPYFIKALTI